MTTRHLESVLNPRSVVLVGASQTPGRLGHIIAQNLVNGGFRGPLYAINPKYDRVAGIDCYASVEALPDVPDLAIIATPASSVPNIVLALAKKGVKGAVVTSAGFGEGHDAEGLSRQQAMLDASRTTGLRLFGPNCVGLLLPRILLNASFAHKAPKGGNLAVLAQSGAVLTGLIDWAAEQAVGFSVMASMGAMADVDFGDLLNYLADDPHTDAILLYVEAVSEARKFLSAARAAARVKPVIVLKSGKTAQGSQAAASHTGALAGSDAVYDAAFARAGLLRVDSMTELFDAAELLAKRRPQPGKRLAILTNGGGFGVMAADALIQAGGELAQLSAQTLAALDQVLPSTWSHSNPIDIIGDAPAERYLAALHILQHAPECDALLVMHCPVATVNAGDLAQAVAKQCQDWQNTVLSAWIGGHHMSGARGHFAAASIPCYDSPDAAVQALMQLQRYQRNQHLLLQTPRHLPEDFKPQPEAAQDAIREAFAEGRMWLSQSQVQRVFEAYRLPIAHLHFAANAERAAERAEALQGPVALKIASKDITHKSDVGGVLLNLEGYAAVHSAAQHMLEKLQRQFPEAQIDGFDVQPMVDRRHSYELIAGMTVDAIFGPVMLIGHGGVATEVLADSALALPPINMKIARSMLEHTRIGRLLKGFRDRPPVDIDAVCATLVKLSRLVADCPQLQELDINPLLVSERGVMALDCRMRVAASDDTGADRFAIRPYPQAWVRSGIEHRGQHYRVRPIRGDDEAMLRHWAKQFEQIQLRLQQHQPIRRLNHRLAARLSQIDFDREMVFLLQALPGKALIGVARLVADPEGERVEFAAQLPDSAWSQGLAEVLLGVCIDYARERGYRHLFCHLPEGQPSHASAWRQLGFEREGHCAQLRL